MISEPNIVFSVSVNHQYLIRIRKSVNKDILQVRVL